MDLGISKDDLEFAFERHATSKIRQADDLETVKSMGFRGEALASITAIANVEMISKTEDDEIGTKIVVEAGKVLEKEDTACQVGTTITVNNLFFNTPVRYKFLKKDFTEAGYIEDVVTRVALANPSVSIKLISGAKTIIQTTGNGEIKDVIYSIYGKEVAEGIVPVSYEYEDIKVSGVVGKPEIARGNRSYQMFFVNNRYIKDKTLSAATDQAFKGLLTIGKYAFLVLNIEIDPKKIDVNVHPTKLEIRWSEEQKVFKAIYHSIRESLLKEELVSNTEKSVEEDKDNNENDDNQSRDKQEINPYESFKSQTIRMPSFINIFKKKEEQENIEEDIPDPNNTIQALYDLKNRIDNKEDKNENNENIENTDSKDEEGVTYEIPEANIQEKEDEKSQDNEETYETQKIEIPDLEEEPVVKKEDFKLPTEEQLDKAAEMIKMQKNMVDISRVSDDPEEKFGDMYEKAFGKIPETEKINEPGRNVESIKFDSVENVSLFEKEDRYIKMPAYKFIGALFSTYLVIEIKDEIYIIDQHAAHERIMYEKVKKNFYSDEEKDSQIMLLPDIITLSHKEKQIIKENSELFKKAGFIFEDFGDNTIRLIGVPSLCMDLDTKELFIQLLDEIDTVAITAVQEKEDKFISTVACKAAVKAKMALNKEEVDKLMEQLLPLPNPFTCPHGRPTAIKMSKNDIERKFSRR